LYLTLSPEAHDELEALAVAANRAADHAIGELDEAITSVKRALKGSRRKK
jgi:hypothetical protein